MVKTNKLGKMSFMLGVVLLVVLMFLAIANTSANADDYLSKGGENFEGGPHWYLFIENYLLMPDNATLTLWSDCSMPHYYQVVNKADLICRAGMIRIPAGVPVYLSGGLGVDNWTMLATDIEGAFIFEGNTGAPAIPVAGHQVVYSNVCGINGIPVGDHIIGLWAGWGSCGGIGGDDDCDCDCDSDSDNPDGPTPTPPPKDNPPTPTPKTGDARSIVLIAAFALCSALVLATTFRKKSEAEQ